MNLTNLCRLAIIENEVGGNLQLAYQFSDPDGTQTGKSGYSFGICQFDIENNWDGILCLKACGFRPKDMNRLFEQRGPIDDLDAKLQKNKKTVDDADDAHIEGSVYHVLKYCGNRMSNETFVHLVDYHNQFYITPGGKMHKFIKALGRRPEPNDILQLKMSTLWGQKKPEDVKRRFNNIKNLCL